MLSADGLLAPALRGFGRLMVAFDGALASIDDPELDDAIDRAATPAPSQDIAAEGRMGRDGRHSPRCGRLAHLVPTRTERDLPRVPIGSDQSAGRS